MSLTSFTFLPWLPLTEPMKILDVTFLPRDQAIEQAGNQGMYVDHGTSYFFEATRSFDDADESTVLTPITEMAVALHTDQSSVVRAERAIYAWSFSTIFTNDQYSYANSSVFAHYQQLIGGSVGMLAMRYRTMHGSKLSGTLATNAMQTKPGWCGAYHKPHDELLRALERGMRKGNDWLINGLETLYSATSDVETLPDQTEYALFRVAVERLLYRPNVKRNHDTIDRHIANVLEPFLNDRLPLPEMYLPRSFDLSKLNIVSTLDAIGEERHVAFHAKPRISDLKPFETQSKFRRNIVAFRAVTALILALLNEVEPTVELDPTLWAFVPAVEEWIEGIGTTEQSENSRPTALETFFLYCQRARRRKPKSGRLIKDESIPEN